MWTVCLILIYIYVRMGIGSTSIILQYLEDKAMAAGYTSTRVNSSLSMRRCMGYIRVCRSRKVVTWWVVSPCADVRYIRACRSRKVVTWWVVSPCADVRYIRVCQSRKLNAAASYCDVMWTGVETSACGLLDR